MVRYSILGSGSCGNSYVFSFNGHSIMVDAGYSLKQIVQRMADGGFDIAEVDALFLTHLHPDHAHSAGTFARRFHKSVYLSAKCLSYAGSEYWALNIPKDCECTIDQGQMVEVGPFVVECFYTSHDSAGSCGYCISVDGKTFVIVTDTGCYNNLMVQAARDADVLFLESNYDVEMLRRGPYPLALQRRVAGQRGHLSNDQAVGFLSDAGFAENGKLVHLIHLSANNNTVQLVQAATQGFNAHVCARGERYCYDIN